MKILFLVFYFFAFFSSANAQIDTIHIDFNKKRYIERIEKEFEYDEISLFLPIYSLFVDTVYKCGDNIEYFINFTQDPALQICFLGDNDYSFIKESLKDNSRYPFFYQYVCNPVVFRKENMVKKILQYGESHPDEFLFAILDIDGIWSISSNELCKLEPNMLGKLRRIDANRFFLNYGEKRINNIIEGKGVGVGIKYYPCKYENHFKRVVLIVDDEQ